MKSVRFNRNKNNKIIDDMACNDENHVYDSIKSDLFDVEFKKNSALKKTKKNAEKVNNFLRFQLEKAFRSIQNLKFQLNEKTAQLDTVNKMLKVSQDSTKQLQTRIVSPKPFEILESNNLLVDAEAKIDELKTENKLKNKVIEELHEQLNDAFQATASVANNNCIANVCNQNNLMQIEDLTLKIGRYETEIAKLEQKLINSNEEKEYYKKHNQNVNHGNFSTINNCSPQSNAMNDEFGRELMLANKRKYQLESKVKQMEQEIIEAQSMSQHFERILIDSEKMLGLEKERSSALENELIILKKQINVIHFENDQLSSNINFCPENEEDCSELNSSNNSNHYYKELENLHKNYNEKISDLLELRSQTEWHLGEVTQHWQDAKWRVGELEAKLAQSAHELDLQLHRIKQLEGVLATPVTLMNDEIERLKKKVGNVSESKSKVEWYLGEVTQFWNDAKWRIGEMEGEISQLRYHLDESRRRNHNLENSSPSAEVEAIRKEKNEIEWRLGEMNQMYNEAKWKIGELQELLIQKENEYKISLNRSNDSNEQKQIWSDLSLKMNGSFIIRKQPGLDRQKWNTILWENTFAINSPLRRVWFEVEAMHESENIFLIGSFVNWECALMCEPVVDNPKQRGVWVDLPIGHHEFRFIRDGKWVTAHNYSMTPNEFGESNNWRLVE